MNNDTEQSNSQTMHLRVLMPTEVLVDEPVVKVIAEADNGEFCLLPRHVDFVATLVPGILVFRTDQAQDNFAAIDEAILVKCGRDVFVSTLNGVRHKDINKLHRLVEERFLELDEHERKTRTALARLEAGTLRGFKQLQEVFRG